MIRSYNNRRACFYRRMSAARMAQKPFTKVTAPKSIVSANSTTGADRNGRKSAAFLLSSDFYTARNRGGAKRLIRSYKNRRACFYRRMSAARMAQKPFTKVTAPKSRMSTNSITGAYLVLGERATNGTAKPSLR